MAVRRMYPLHRFGRVEGCPRDDGLPCLDADAVASQDDEPLLPVSLKGLDSNLEGKRREENTSASDKVKTATPSGLYWMLSLVGLKDES